MKAHVSILITAGLILLITTSAMAADVTLAWDPSSSQNVAGYKIYYKTGSSPTYNGTGLAEGASPIDAGTSLALPLHGLLDGVIYTFTVTSYETDGLESAYSEAITWTTNDPDPFIPALTSPADRAQNLPSSVIFAWSAPTDGRDVSYTLVYGTDPNLQNSNLAFAFPAGKAPANQVGSVQLAGAIGLFGMFLGWQRRKRLPLIALFFTMSLMLAGCGGDATGDFVLSDPGVNSPVTTPAPPESQPSTPPVVQTYTNSIPDIREASFEIYDFEPGTTYYWKIIANDGYSVTESGIQSFVTAAL